jgi:hypothetical protein
VDLGQHSKGCEVDDMISGESEEVFGVRVGLKTLKEQHEEVL